jgi:hypothetical protein
MKILVILSVFSFFSTRSFSQNTPTVVEAQEWVLSKLEKYPKVHKETIDMGVAGLYVTKIYSVSGFKFTNDGKLTNIEHVRVDGHGELPNAYHKELWEIDMKYFKNVEISEGNRLKINTYGDHVRYSVIDSQSNHREYEYTNTNIIGMDITSEPDLHSRIEKALNDIKKHYTSSLLNNEKY